MSLSSFGSIDNTSAPTATAIDATAGPMAVQDSTPSQHLPPPPHHHHQPIAPNPVDMAPSNRAFTFPGPLPPEHDPRAPQRQMSLPGTHYLSPNSGDPGGVEICHSIADASTCPLTPSCRLPELSQVAVGKASQVPLLLDRLYATPQLEEPSAHAQPREAVRMSNVPSALPASARPEAPHEAPHW
jgi:hypothetical protein